MTASENQIVVCQPNETVRPIVWFPNKTIFMAIVQQLMAEVHWIWEA